MRDTFKKFGQEGKTPKGGIPHSPFIGRFRLAEYLGYLRVNIFTKFQLSRKLFGCMLHI